MTGPDLASRLTPVQPPQVADPSTMVIFGATGDLAKRKLLPALYNLNGEKLLPDQFAVVGVGRQAMSADEYRDKVSGDLGEFGTQVVPGACEWLERRLSYVQGQIDEDALYEQLATTLAATANVMFYLATPPSLFGPIVRKLGAHGLLDESRGWRRVVVEKPFGHDLASARALNRLLAEELDERQIFRIDHYLGKETVQNVMAFRFGNGIFEPIWNRRYVDHVQITVAETVGVELRGSYYDKTGALRDMIQNHLFQLLALTALEPPISFEAEAVRDERLKVLNAIQAIQPGDVDRIAVRGQYAAGRLGDRPVPAYRDEPEVATGSETETFVALEVHVDNWRWAGVPFYLRTGKRLASRASEIVVRFKSAPFSLFRETPVEVLDPNELVIRVQPNEGIAMRFQAKVPGPDVQLGTVRMDFSYADYFGLKPNTGYETLLYDVMTGDATLFHRADIVETGWRVVMPILEHWAATPDGVHDYPAGSWGPAAADALIRRDGRRWHAPGS
ncbi:MAG: glucose-6-phosphate dehydrogenase [Vicinamibacterales bacterium]